MELTEMCRICQREHCMGEWRIQITPSVNRNKRTAKEMQSPQAERVQSKMKSSLTNSPMMRSNYTVVETKTEPQEKEWLFRRSLSKQKAVASLTLERVEQAASLMTE
jgi:hypothetical protein